MTTHPLNWTFRAQFLAGFMVCAGLLGYALYVQFHMLMLPCPLCILQRLAFVALGLVFLAGGLHAPRGRFGRAVYGLLALLAAGLGAGIAGRHVWLQSLPPGDVPLCTSMGLDYMVEVMGPTAALTKVLAGSGECAKVDWTFLGLAMPAWTLVCFALLGVGALWSALRRRAVA